MSEETKPHIVKSHDINLDSDYVNWIHDVKQRYISTQIKAAVKVNTERLYFNWQLGRDLVERKAEEKCSGFLRSGTINSSVACCSERRGLCENRAG